MHQGPVSLAWYSFFRNKALRLPLLKLTRRQAIGYLIGFLQHKLELKPSSEPVLELPVYGSLCLEVNNGHKVFDFKRKTVIKVIGPEIEEAAAVSEIERARSAAFLDFVPNIRNWNVKQRWYEEDYVIGDSGYSIPQRAGVNLLRIYYHHIAPVIEALILLKPPRTKPVGVYLDETIRVLDNGVLSNSELNGDKIETIRCFVKTVVRQLDPSRNAQVTLIFSHGDFSFVNILDTATGMKVIDWEDAARRSILNDFYNYFFTELYYRRVKTNLVAEMDDAITSLQASLRAKPGDLAGNLRSSAELYRRLYYLERIQLLLEREPGDKTLDVVLRSIEVYTHYEEAVGNQPFSNK